METKACLIDLKFLDVWALRQWMIREDSFDRVYPELQGEPKHVNKRGRVVEIVCGRKDKITLPVSLLDTFKQEWRTRRFPLSLAPSMEICHDPDIAGFLMSSKWVAHGHLHYKAISCDRKGFKRSISTIGGAVLERNDDAYALIEMPVNGVVAIMDTCFSTGDRYATVITRSRC